MTPEPFSKTDVLKWLEAVRAETEQLHGRLAPLLADQRRLQERETLLKGLLASFDPSDGASPAAEENESPATRSGSYGGGSVRSYVVDRAVEILRDAGTPLHINEIHGRFISNGYPIPGAGRPVNLTAHLGRSDLIVSPKRGEYALAELVGVVKKPKPKTKRKKRRTRTRKTTKKG